MPTTEPIRIEISVAKNPTSSEIRDPHTVSANTDRPRSSVPNGNPRLGGWSGGPVEGHDGCGCSSSGGGGGETGGGGGRGGLGWGPGGLEGDQSHQPARTRGSRAAYSRSAAKLATITATLNSRNTPWSSGRAL